MRQHLPALTTNLIEAGVWLARILRGIAAIAASPLQMLEGPVPSGSFVMPLVSSGKERHRIVVKHIAQALCARPMDAIGRRSVKATVRRTTVELGKEIH